ncbi:hypothetical protein ATANTOWER_021147, partial [Ataeniobius toweri]|nr:hypothetical protein [Ataeniobius toweri]
TQSLGRFPGKKESFFLCRYEANIIPKLKPVAVVEPRMWSLLKGIPRRTEDEGCYSTFGLLTHLLPPVGAIHAIVKTPAVVFNL